MAYYDRNRAFEAQQYTEYLNAHRSYCELLNIDAVPLTFSQWQQARDEADQLMFSDEEYAQAFIATAYPTEDEIDAMYERYAMGGN